MHLLYVSLFFVSPFLFLHSCASIERPKAATHSSSSNSRKSVKRHIHTEKDVNLPVSDPAACIRHGKVLSVSRCVGHGMAVPVDAQGAADVEVVLARVVAQIEVHAAAVAHTAGAFLARRIGQAHPVLTGAVWTAEVAVDFRVANPVIGTILMGAAAFSTGTVPHSSDGTKN